MKLNQTKKIIRKSSKKFFDVNNQHLAKSFSEITEIISLMSKVDLKSPQAKANIISISDNNGKRIFL